MQMNFIFDDGSRTSVDLNEIEYSMTTRWKRSLKIFFILFGISIFSIFVPVLHFVLVPGFLIAAGVMAWLTFQESKFIDLANVPCPKCSAPFSEKGLHPNKKQKFIKIYCYHCRTNMKLSQGLG